MRGGFSVIVVVAAAGSSSSSSHALRGLSSLASRHARPPSRVRMAAADALVSVHVRGTVIPGAMDAFLSATAKNARASVREAGIARFDVLTRLPADDDDDENKLEDQNAATGFLLVEAYRGEEAPALHKATEHYERWRDDVADLMAAPRAATKYTTLFPPAAHWATTPQKAHAFEQEEDEEEGSTTDKGGSVSLAGSVSRHDSGSRRSRRRFTNNLLATVTQLDVVPGREMEFRDATMAYCRRSVLEAGVARCDLQVASDDPKTYCLVEVFRDADALNKHEHALHTARWRDTIYGGKILVDGTLRSYERYATAYPAPLFWDASARERRRNSESTHRGLSNCGAAVPIETTGFAFQTPPKIRVGRGIAGRAILDALSSSSSSDQTGKKKPFVVSGASGVERHADALGEEVVQVLAASPSYRVHREPTVADAIKAANEARAQGCGIIVAIGGGSAIDLGKAVAALATNLGTTDMSETPSTAYTYLESVGEGKPISRKPLPVVAVPTTAGTGSEATKNAVLKCQLKNRKASMRADSMLPAVAIVDPTLTLTCPPDVTAHVGLDALIQCVEPFVSCFANPIVDALAADGTRRAARSLREVVADGTRNLEAREDLALASLFGGLCLANAKLGAVHGFAGVLGGAFENAPHGAVCAALFAPVFRANVKRLEAECAKAATHETDGEDEKKTTHQQMLDRFTEVARLLTGDDDAAPDDAADWIDALVADLRVPGLRDLCDMGDDGPDDDTIRDIVAATATASSTKGNPVELSVEDLDAILRAAL